MKLNFQKLAVYTASLSLAVFGVTVAAPARAADCPYPVQDQSDNDHPKAVIKLISPVLDDTNSTRRYDFESQFTNDCDWFGVGMRFFQVYVPFGQNATLTFHASTPAGVSLANTKVRLRANKGYSASNAATRVNGIKARPAPSNASDGADVDATTDVNGNVSFVIGSPTDCTVYGGTLPSAPSSFDAPTPNDRNADPTTDCYSQFLPQITGEKTDNSDFVELHYYDASAENFSTDSATVKLLAPTLGDTNSIQGDGVIQSYSLVGSKQVVALQATKDDGSWARNLPVKVRINLANSGANAKISAGIIGNTALGSATMLTNSDGTKTAEDQLVLSGTTDAFGTVTFQLNNTDTDGEPQPATLTSPVPVSGAKFVKLAAELTNVTTMGDALELHYYKPVPPTAIAITASGRKITVTITNAAGKSGTVSITGKSKVTVRPTKTPQVYTYTVTAGVKTVVVTANGKSLTKKFTIK